MSFRSLLDEALKSQLEERIPFLYGTMEDVHDHNASSNRRVIFLYVLLKSAFIIISSLCSSDQQSTLVNEMASAAGFASQIDPLLLQTLQSLPKSDFEEEYLVSCLLMVFVAVSVPKLARSESSFYRVSQNCQVFKWTYADIVRTFLLQHLTGAARRPREQHPHSGIVGKPNIWCHVHHLRPR